MIVICEHCRTEFEARRSTAKYCSPKCRKAAFDARKVSVLSVTNANSSADQAILAALSDLSIQLAQVKEGLGTEIQSVRRDIQDIQVTTVTTVRTTSARQSDSDLDDLIQEVELTEEEKAERGRQATQNFLNSLTSMAATSKGPRKLETPPLAAPTEDDFDDIEL